MVVRADTSIYATQSSLTQQHSWWLRNRQSEEEYLTLRQAHGSTWLVAEKGVVSGRCYLLSVCFSYCAGAILLPISYQQPPMLINGDSGEKKTTARRHFCPGLPLCFSAFPASTSCDIVKTEKWSGKLGKVRERGQPWHSPSPIPAPSDVVEGEKWSATPKPSKSYLKIFFPLSLNFLLSACIQLLHML